MVKIDVISGFLGAGKTTFANKLLEYYMSLGLTPAYIANEFGEAVLDAQVIESKGFTAVQMEGGCICCSLKDDVTTTLISVLDAFSPDVIVFEPSGVFVFDNFFDIVKEDSLREKCVIGNVFTIIDGVNFKASTAVYGSFIYNQIRNSPALIISKLEKITRNADDIISELREINPDGVIMSDFWSALDSNWFKALLEKRPAEMPNFPDHHHHALQTLTITNPKPLTGVDFDGFIKTHKSGGWGDVYRIKGVVVVDGVQKLLNVAFHDVDLTDYESSREMNITFIGDTVKTEAIKSFFA